MKKSVSIVLVILILCIILLCGGGVYAYFFTDIFKSDKELFFKYITENETIAEVLSFDELEEYGKKQETTSYTGSGSIKTNNNFEIESMDSNTAELLSDSNITFSSNIDKQNNYVYSNINLNYSDEETLSIEYANIDDYYGIKIESILKKFLTVENSDLKEFATNLGVDESVIDSIPDSINFDELTSQADLFTESELSEIKTTYYNILAENLTDDMFTSSISEDGQDVYTLTITETQCSNIVIKLLEQLENDETIINKLKEYAINSGFTETEADEYVSQFKEQIEEIINELNESSSQEVSINDETDTSTNLIISVYVENKNMTKVELILDEVQLTLSTGENTITLEYLNSETETTSSSSSYSVSLQKTSTEDTFEYRFVCNSGEDTIIDFQIDYTGLRELTQVEEKSILTVNLEDGYELGYTYTNTKDFTGATSDEQIEESDLYILNEQENPLSTIETFSELLTELNTEQMEALGVESNPMTYYAPSAIQAIMTSSLSTGDLSNVMLAGEVSAIGLVVYEFAQLGVQLTGDLQGTNSNLEDATSEELLNGAKDICDEIASQEDFSEDIESVDDIDEYIVNEINNYDWASYSTDITCTAIFVSGESTIEIVSLIDGATLRGTLYYGVITWGEIETETSQKSSLEETQKEVFNAQFEAYTGNNKTASEVKTLIAAMIASNASESTYGENRYVSLNYDGTIYDESSLQDFDTSLISSAYLYSINAEEYDEETGYISVITVEKNETEENTETESNSIEISF